MIYLTHGFIQGQPLKKAPLPGPETLPETSLPDIVLGPGGAAGFYSLGISSYIVNHFDIQGKSIVGFSAGSFILLFMRIQPEKRNAMLQRIFECNETNTLPLLKRLMEMLETTTTLNDYDLSGASIAVSHPQGVALYNTFLNMSQLVRCCRSSSFIPFVTYPSGANFYNNSLAVDGFVYYRSFLRQYPEKPLVITPLMFGRYPNSIYHKIRFLFGIHPLKTTSIYQMYLYGYQDAKKNHAYFEKYLKPLTKA
jgi:hypothetical protein